MTQAELKTHLKSLGLPLAYSHFPVDENTPPPVPPFITYRFDGSNDLLADNENYAEISTYSIELYTNKKDLAAEKLVQDKLKSLKIPYTKLETWIENEKLFQVAYEIQLI